MENSTKIPVPKLPLYKCHKVVGASKIFELIDAKDGRFLALTHSGAKQISHEFFNIATGHICRTGDQGYLVVYDDSHISWSPSKAFEEGYTLIKEDKDKACMTDCTPKDEPVDEKERFTFNDAEILVKTVQFQRFKGTTRTVCCLLLENGFSVSGESSCDLLSEFDEEKGRRYAYEGAIGKVVEFMVYARKEKAHEELISSLQAAAKIMDETDISKELVVPPFLSLP